MTSQETIQVKKEGVRAYEVAFIGALEGVGDSVLNVIQGVGGIEVIHTEPVKPIVLAYDIAKQSNGFFGYVQYTGTPDTVRKLSAALDGKKDILRYLIIKDPIIRRVHEARPESVTSDVPVSQSAKEPSREHLTNEDLEAKLEEILK